MPRSSSSIEIAASRERVFDVLHDYERRLEWDPFLRRADVLHGEDEAGVGVQTYCAAKLRAGWLGMVTEYVSFDRPRVAAVRMISGPPVMRDFAASLRQRSTERGGTEVVYTYTFKVRPAALDWLLRPLFDRYFRHETRRRLASLKAYVESGV